ncbi:hypothetical protein MTBBW1_1310082 [Desulfamplus magnetovallimortis]|uniref:Uncharacterized protein n=1 Tax=Desulfamplus magnetovallimortis TaxID=1246637 RepID=A0A1W1H7H1_9BACT|nr:hypothetical protein MTBBW1_1310082 [Desulfamplus magnetovallimortis]
MTGEGGNGTVISDSFLNVICCKFKTRGYSEDIPIIICKIQEQDKK